MPHNDIDGAILRATFHHVHLLYMLQMQICKTEKIKQVQRDWSNAQIEWAMKIEVWKQKYFKGYLRYKTIFCHKVVLDAQLMNFYIWDKNNVLFSRYLDFCVYVKSTDFKICDVIICIATQWKLHFCLFLLNPKAYQNEILSTTSVLHGKHF